MADDRRGSRGAGGTLTPGLPAVPAAPRPATAPADTVTLVARLLAVGTYVSVVLAALGTVLMLIAGHVPVRQRGPAFDPARLPADLLAGRASAFLWVALLVAVLLPSGRVLLAAAGYVREGDARQARVALAVLCVLAVSTGLALVTR